MQQSYEGAEFPGPVTFKKPRPGDMPYYEMPADQLGHGASLANRRIWVSTRGSGAIERVFCIGAGKNLLGSIVVTYALPTQTLITSAPEAGCVEGGQKIHVLLEQEGPGIVEIYPFKQTHSFDLTGEVHVEETVLVPKMEEYDPPAVLQGIRLTNSSDSDCTIMLSIYVDLHADMGDDLVVEFDQRLGALIAHNKSQPNWVRIVGAESCEVAYRTTHDSSESYAAAQANKVEEGDQLAPAPLGELQLELEVRAGKTAETAIVAVVSSEGVDDARAYYERIGSYETQSEVTFKHLTPLASAAAVETPDPVINQGVFWAKVNMIKVKADYPEGTAFTNEPGLSSNVVGRDVAWFVYGCDYLDPDFSGELLLKFAEKQYPSGKIPEYYNALDGHVEDYGISMNDDTPLFVLACCHHYSCTRDQDFLREIYPSAKKALDYILSQRDDRGLVISQASGYEVKGIASWRNVIPNYQINGAVTEINSECFAALECAAKLANFAGEPEDSERFGRAAKDLRTAINYALLNPNNGLYYLNIDQQGQVHTDVTSDEIFPVLFGVAEQNSALRIVSRLRGPDFMTTAGLRTLSRNSPDYEPTRLIGLLGGVWPGVAFWYAFAASKLNPEFMVRALHAGYVQYLVDPLKNNTVPGQFSEWFDGESLVNRGMRLSPWEPPRLLWAAVEGLCGAKGGIDGYELAPNRPPGWSWLAIRRLPCESGFLSYFTIFHNEETHIYANREVKTEHELHVAGQDVSHKVRVRDYRVHRAAFDGPEGLTICLGSEASAYVTVPIALHDLLDPSRQYRLSVRSRLWGWTDLGISTGTELSELAISIEDGGYRILRMTPVEPA